jgi:hypothetical protein
MADAKVKSSPLFTRLGSLLLNSFEVSLYDIALNTISFAMAFLPFLKASWASPRYAQPNFLVPTV